MKKETVAQSVGKRLKELRQAFHFTPESIAKILEIAPLQWRLYEQGKEPINIALLAEVANVFEVPMSYFFEDMLNCKLGINMLYNSESQNLLAAYYQVSNRETAKHIYNLLQSLVDN